MPAAVIKMPTATTDSEEDGRSEQMWTALKRHILRERERKKQEREAEVEEERLRKEREARQQQDVMTLGETKEQISQLEAKLAHLKEEKHQLFLQLKKVLNEDDNRRKQLTKEASEVMPMQGLYMPPQGMPRGMPVTQQNFKAAPGKRPRSPSPTPSSMPVYHPNYAYKPAAISNASYQSPQKDDARRHELRAVLWNKPPQYPPNQPPYYTVPPQELSIYYPQQAPPPPPPPPQPRQQLATQQQQQQQQQQQAFAAAAAAAAAAYHIEAAAVKPSMEQHYSSLRQPTAHIMHAPPPSGAVKSGGSITAGYPVRQTQYQPPPPGQPATLYTTQSRPLYQSAGGGPINYPTRD